MTHKALHDDSLPSRAGNHPQVNRGITNPTVYHASTVLFPTVTAMEAAMEDKVAGVYYGRFGTPTTFAVEEAAAALMAFLGSGDHLLMVDSVYDPVRNLCNRTSARFGIETTCTATRRDAAGPTLRLHVGLEDPGDPIADLDGGFARLNAAR